MKRLLQKIAWKTHRWHFELSLLNLYFPSVARQFGFELVTISSHSKSYSLLKIKCRLPDVTGRQLQFDMDFLFLRSYLSKIHDDMMDDRMWNVNRKRSILNKIKYKILGFNI